MQNKIIILVSKTKSNIHPESGTVVTKNDFIVPFCKLNQILKIPISDKISKYI